MIFYSAECFTADKRFTDEKKDRESYEKEISQINKISDELNRESENGCYVYMCSINKTGKITMCAAANMKNASVDFEMFLSKLGITVEEITVKEVTAEKFSILLRTAERNDFIDDRYFEMEKYELDRLINNVSRRLDYGENLVEKAKKSKIVSIAEKGLSGQTLIPEINRIFQNRQRRFTGHPVHYFVYSDNRDTRNEIYRTLLSALYSNKRLESCRYVFIDFESGDRVLDSDYDFLYKSCESGAVVVRCMFSECNYANYSSSDNEIIKRICETAKKYCNSVLTVFCLPVASSEQTEIFKKYLEGMSFITLKEEIADAADAKSFLERIAKNEKVRTDSKLFEQIKEGGTYTAEDLKKIYDNWYNQKLKTVIYPQYADTLHIKKTVENKVEGSAFSKLDSMIGLKEAKSVIKKAVDYYKAQKLFESRGMLNEKLSMHMIFTGNPGTAKTTVARLFAGILKENGILTKGHLVEVGRADLVGKYVGWTAQIVREKFKEAEGGVLFIDEAYSLVEGKDGLFGDEAIDTIVQEMENRRKDIVVIFAGYPKEMEEFLGKNPGLRSRIAFHIPFEDYNAEELCEIARLMAKEKGITITDKAVEKLNGIFENAAKNEDFGNGRFVRNILEKSRMNQASRLVNNDCTGISASELSLLTDEDIEAPALSRATVIKPLIGFSA